MYIVYSAMYTIHYRLVMIKRKFHCINHAMYVNVLNDRHSLVITRARRNAGSESFQLRFVLSNMVVGKLAIRRHFSCLCFVYMDVGVS